MYTGILLGISLWMFFLLFAVVMTAAFGELNGEKTIVVHSKSSLFWIVIFAFIGAIIGYGLNLSIWIGSL